MGCDSVITLDLTINSVSNLSTSLTDATITANNLDATYTWLDCSDEFKPINGESNQSFTAARNGDYSVELTENNCVDTSACVSIKTLKVNNISLSDHFSVFPNPTKGILSIKINEPSGSLSLRLLSISGQVLRHQTFQASDFYEFEITEPAGIYFLELIDELTSKTDIRIIKH